MIFCSRTSHSVGKMWLALQKPSMCALVYTLRSIILNYLIRENNYHPSVGWVCLIEHYVLSCLLAFVQLTWQIRWSLIWRVLFERCITFGPAWANIFFGRGYDLENFQCINFFWIIENYGSPLLHQPCWVARDVCQRSWRVVTAIIAWVFVRDDDLYSIGSNVLTLHATVRASRKFALFLWSNHDQL